MPARKKVELGPDDMLGQLAASLRKQARQPNILGYEPHDKQLQFHSSTAKKRLYIGGNRSGKTTAGVAEGIWYLKGEHPYKRVPEPPVAGRAIGVDLLRGVQGILIPQFKRWIPPSLLVDGSWSKSYHAESRTLTLANGSTLEFMSYEQDTDKFAGVPRHFIHYDEEPPQHIYQENQARLIDYDGDAWFTLTPVEGMTWIYDSLYLPGTDEKSDSSVFVIEADMTDNPHIAGTGIEEFLKGLSKDERDARQSGKFVQLGGLVFKSFNANVNSFKCDATVPPKSWLWYASMDHGYNNPTAWLWHAVSPSGDVITFAEHYQNEMVVADHAKVFHKLNQQFGKLPDIIVGDPAIEQRQGVTGSSIRNEYAQHGVYIMPGNNDVLSGVNQMHDYMKINSVTGKPFWQITENCPNLLRELSRLRWKTWAGRRAQFENNKFDQIHKKDDHAFDSARYFFTCLPSLKPTLEAQEELKLDRSGTIRYDEALIQQTRGRASRSQGWHAPSPDPWQIVDSSLHSLEYD